MTANGVTPQQSVRQWVQRCELGVGGPTPWGEDARLGGQPQIKNLAPNHSSNASNLAVASWPVDPVTSATRHRPVPA